MPLAPTIRLHLAQDAIVLWARLEAEAGHKMAAPFWASAWIGGQALARYVLGHTDLVEDRRVLDLAAGSGIAGIAACLAGARSVTANDIDPNAVAAIGLNAAANGVTIDVDDTDLLGGEEGDGGDAEVILAGDVFYNRAMAEAVMPFLTRAVARGARVLVGDPGRDHMPRESMEVLATYPTRSAAAYSDAEVERVYVLELS